MHERKCSSICVRGYEEVQWEIRVKIVHCVKKNLNVYSRRLKIIDFGHSIGWDWISLPFLPITSYFLSHRLCFSVVPTPSTTAVGLIFHTCLVEAFFFSLFRSTAIIAYFSFPVILRFFGKIRERESRVKMKRAERMWKRYWGRKIEKERDREQERDRGRERERKCSREWKRLWKENCRLLAVYQLVLTVHLFVIIC